MPFHFEHDGQRQGIKNERDFEDHGSQWKCLCSQLHVHAICYNSDYMLLHHNYDHLLRERSDRFGQWNASICSNLALELWFHWFISDPTKLFLKLKVGSNGWASHSLFTNEYSLFFFTRTNSERTAKHLGPVSIHAAFIPIRSYRLWTLRTWKQLFLGTNMDMLDSASPSTHCVLFDSHLHWSNHTKRLRSD